MPAHASAPPERQNGFTTALNVIIAPHEAFKTLRIAPTWGWAFLIAGVLGLVGAVMNLPASTHGTAASIAHQMATNPQYAQMSEVQRQQLQSYSLAAVRFGWLFVPIFLLLSVLFQTVIMLASSAIGGGSGTFKILWACAMNIAIPGFGLYYLATGIIALVRGPATYNSSLDSFLTIPSLGWLLPHGSPATVAFFSTINPFSIWTLYLTAGAMLIVARTSKINAYLVASLIWLIAAAFSMWAGSRS